MWPVSNNIFLHFGTAHEQISDMISKFGLISLLILDQVHGNDGLVITKHNLSIPFKSKVGDYLITNQRNIGLGVLTADCLPIIFVDTVTRAVGIAHAGWRGSVKNIASITLEHMQQQYGTKIADVSVFFGPCAKVCCYEVQPDFIANIRAARPKFCSCARPELVEGYPRALEEILQQVQDERERELSQFSGVCYEKNCVVSVDASKFLIRRNGNLFFDLPQFNKQLLVSAGLPKTAMNEQYNCCTICNDDYFSFRRQGEAAGRNVSVVWIR